MDGGGGGWTEQTNKQTNKAKKCKKAYNTGTSRVVPHHSTIPAARSLTSRFGWDVVYSASYGRRHQLKVCNRVLSLRGLCVCVCVLITKWMCVCVGVWVRQNKICVCAYFACWENTHTHTLE